MFTLHRRRYKLAFVAAAIRIRREILASLLDQARREPNLECSGLLAGRDSVITLALPAANVAANPATAYEIAAEDLFRLMREIRAAGLELLGIYHSHPAGENKPSAQDIERAYYPDAAYFILSPRKDAPQPVRAFSLCNGRASELEIQIVDD
jgi:proteasome lid subunit RPN8/RPN11